MAAGSASAPRLSCPQETSSASPLLAYRLGHPYAPETRRNVVRCFKQVLLEHPAWGYVRLCAETGRRAGPCTRTARNYVDAYLDAADYDEAAPRGGSRQPSP